MPLGRVIDTIGDGLAQPVGVFAVMVT